MAKRVPVPNGTTVWVCSDVNLARPTPSNIAAAEWIEVPKITSLTHSGGDERFITFSRLDEDDDGRVLDGRNPVDIQMTFQDGYGEAHIAAISAGIAGKAPLAWKLRLPGGATNIVFAGYSSGSLIPVFDRNQVMVIAVLIAVLGAPRRISI